jgi:hypothetical protein
MKKIFILFTALLFCLSIVNAQTIQMTGTYTTGDTVLNTATKACSLKLAKSYKQVSIQTVITKISGTVAGTVTLQGSVDGTNYVTVDSAAILSNHSPFPTYTATNTATQSKVWIVNNSPYLWFKLSYTGSGTMSATLKGYLLPRPVQD